MARMRSLKPEFWVDRKLARSLTRDQRMLYVALWNQADEWARLMADPRLLKGQCFPYDDDVTLDYIEAMLDALEAAGVAQQYEVDGDPYVWLPKLAKHQRLEPSKVPSRLPEPPEMQDDQQVCAAPKVRANESARDLDESARDANQLSLMQVAGGREHVAGQQRADESAPTKAKRATQAPDDFQITDAMRAWAADNNIRVDLERETVRFLGHHRAKGTTFKDWVQAWQNWMRKSEDFQPAHLRAVPNDPHAGKVKHVQVGPNQWRPVTQDEVCYGKKTRWM